MASTHNVSVALFGNTLSYTFMVNKGMASTKILINTVAKMTK